MSCNCKVQTDKPCVRVLDLKHRVGGHVELKKTLLETLKQSSSSGSHCVQFFLGSAQGYTCRNVDKTDIEKTKKYCEMYGKTFMSIARLLPTYQKTQKVKTKKNKQCSKNRGNALRLK